MLEKELTKEQLQAIVRFDPVKEEFKRNIKKFEKLVIRNIENDQHLKIDKFFTYYTHFKSKINDFLKDLDEYCFWKMKKIKEESLKELEFKMESNFSAAQRDLREMYAMVKNEPKWQNLEVYIKITLNTFESFTKNLNLFLNLSFD